MGVNFVLINYYILKTSGNNLQQTIFIQLKIKPLSILGTRSTEYCLRYAMGSVY